jgi:hypothetical protein
MVYLPERLEMQPDPLVRGTDPAIRIRTKISRSPNTQSFYTVCPVDRMPARFFHHDPSMNLIPIVIEQTGRGERSYDIYSRLLKVGFIKRETHIGQLLLFSASALKKPGTGSELIAD